MPRRNRIAALAAAALSLGGAGAAHAQTYSTISLTPYANRSWVGDWGVTSFPSGAQTFNGTPFAIPGDAAGARYASAYGATGANSPGAVTIATDVARATDAYSLINTIWGQPGPSSYLSISFVGAAGHTQTFALIGGTDIRDFNQYAYVNTINGTSTVNAITVDGGQHRLDEQRYALDADFLTQHIVAVVMTDTGADGFERGALSGLTFRVQDAPAGAVPEPAAWALMIAGFGATGAALRRRPAAARCAWAEERGA